MEAKTHTTKMLGDLIADAFDEAARRTADPKEASRLATEAVIRLLRGARWLSAAPQPATCLEAARTWD